MMIFSCSICSRNYDSQLDSMECYYSHEEFMNHLLAYETPLEKFCQKNIEKNNLNTTIRRAQRAAINLVESLEEFETIEHTKIINSAMETLIYSIQLAFIFCEDSSDMDCSLSKKMAELKLLRKW